MCLRQVSSSHQRLRSTLDLAVQEIRVGSECNGGHGKDPCKGLGRTVTDTATVDTAALAGTGQTRQDSAEEFTSRSVLGVKGHVLLTLDSCLVRLLAQFGDLVLFFVLAVGVLVLVVVVVVVAVRLLARHAARSLDDGLAGVRQTGAGACGEQVGGGVGSASLIVEDTHVDGLAVACAVGTGVEASVVITVVVSVVVLVSIVVVVVVIVVVAAVNFCKKKGIKMRHLSI